MANMTDFDAENSTNLTDLVINVTIICDGGETGDVLSSVYFHAVVYFFYITIMVLSMFGNGIVCYLVHSAPRMRSVKYFFIVNLSVGDILMTIFCIPFSFVSVLTLRHWPFGEVLCRTVSYSQAISVFVSAYTLVAISIDRYMAIMWPLRPRMTKSHAKIIIVLVWLIALLTALPILIVSSMLQPPEEWYSKCDRYVCQENWTKREHGFYYSLVLMTLQYAVPFIVLVYTYTRIAVVVWGKKTPGEAENTRDQRLAKSKRKVNICLFVEDRNLKTSIINIAQFDSISKIAIIITLLEKRSICMILRHMQVNTFHEETVYLLRLPPVRQRHQNQN